MSAFIERTREVREQEERDRLAPAATRSSDSRGRIRDESPDEHRTAFERDRDRIMHSKAFRRLKHKTQVFINPDGDHFVTRLTHTVQVTQISRAIAAALSLNETLTEAIALAHDVGHSPFGHTGEDALGPYFPGRGWHHSAQGLRVVELLEDLNLTWEVRDGIRAHTWRIEPPPSTPEAFCVRYGDRIAYLTHDALDAVRAGVLSPYSFPDRVIERFGEPGRRWIGEMITAVIEESLRAGTVQMDADTLQVMHELRDFMFERVYLSETQLTLQRRAVELTRAVVDHLLAHPDELPLAFRETDDDDLTQVIDYVAGMTDRFAVATYERLIGPSPLAVGAIS